MARIAFRAFVTNTAPYVVPAGKTAIFGAFGSQIKAGEITIGGVSITVIKGASVVVTPLTANAGDVISTPNISPGDGGSSFSIAGFLYDN